jgi:hypothetical protein
MLLKAQEDINQYDYKKMMSDFETETRHKKIINGIKNKWRIASTKYLEKVDLIKDRNKKLDKKRQREYKKRYKEKELSIQNQLEQKKYEILEKKKNMAEAIRKKNEDAAKNLEKFHELQEKERLKVEQDTMNKSKKLLFIIYFYYSEIN